MASGAMEPREPRASARARSDRESVPRSCCFPGLAGRMWIGPDAARRPVKVLARAFGVRDLAIGLGVVIALDRGTPVRGWIEAGALSDVIDTCASLLAGGSIHAGDPLARDRGREPRRPRPAPRWRSSSTTVLEPIPGQTPEAVLTGHPPRLEPQR